MSGAVCDDEVNDGDGKLNDMRKTKISNSMPVRINAPEMVKPKRGVSLLASNERRPSDGRENEFKLADAAPLYRGASGVQPVVGSGVLGSGVEALGEADSQSGGCASGSAMPMVADGVISFPAFPGNGNWSANVAVLVLLNNCCSCAPLSAK